MKRKLACILLSLALLFNFACIFPSVVSAANSSASYSGDGWKAVYTVKDAWGDTQMVEIKLTNTGTASFNSWALRVNAEGKIEEPWDAELLASENGIHFLGSKSYNSTLKANQSATFGFKLQKGSGTAPEEVQLCSGRKEKSGGYEASFQASSQWDNGATGQFVIRNTGKEVIRGWELSFDAGFTIQNLWNGTLLHTEKNRYTISGADSTAAIQPGTSVSIGVSCAGKDMSIKNVSLSEVIINTKPDIQIYLSASSKDGKIGLEWISQKPAGSFTVLCSENGTTFSAIGTVKEGCQYEFAPKGAGRYWFRIRQDSEIPPVESNTVQIQKTTAGDYEPVLKDTDQDGLDDALENWIGTNPLKADTDGDGLSDYEELYRTHTDPLKADTDGNGVPDGSEDPDEDNLLNSEEMEKGTDPMNPDTDGDGLLDGDEAKQYRTDPVKYDTDGDGLSDGDEIKLGLDPLSPTTHGVTDGEYMVDQNVSADKLSGIQGVDLPFEVSLEIRAAGLVESHIINGESSYATALSGNPAIQGKPVELIYPGKVEKAKISFRLDDVLVKKSEEYKAQKSDAAPLEQFQIFRYDDANNLLYPVKTAAEGSVVSTETDQLGTYCLVDLLEWDRLLKAQPMSQANLLTAEPETKIGPISAEEQEAALAEARRLLEEMAQSESQPEPPSIEPETPEESCPSDEVPPSDAPDSLEASEEERLLAEQKVQEVLSELQTTQPLPMLLSGEEPTERKKMDIVLAIDSTGFMTFTTNYAPGGDAAVYKSYYQATYFIYELLVALMQNNIDWRICIMDFKLYPDDGEAARTIYRGADGSVWMTDSDDVVTAVGEIREKTKIAPETMQTPWDALGYAPFELDFREGAARHAILMTNQVWNDENRYGIKDIDDMALTMKEHGIYTHTITSEFLTDYFLPFMTCSGCIYPFYKDFIIQFPARNMITFMLRVDPMPVTAPKDELSIVTSMGLESVLTDAIYGKDMELLDRDVDGDGLTNREEIREDLLPNGFSPDQLPRLKYLAEQLDPANADGFSKELLKDKAELRVLPLSSDPRKRDSDRDGFLDLDDNLPFHAQYMDFLEDQWYHISDNSRSHFLNDTMGTQPSSGDGTAFQFEWKQQGEFGAYIIHPAADRQKALTFNPETQKLTLETATGDTNQLWIISIDDEYGMVRIKSASVMNDKNGWYLDLSGGSAVFSHSPAAIYLNLLADWTPFGKAYMAYDFLVTHSAAGSVIISDETIRAMQNYRENIRYKTERLGPDEKNDQENPFNSDRFITGQMYYEPLKVGESDVNYAGCGIIGPYNALRVRKLVNQGLEMTSSVKTDDFYKMLAEFDMQNLLLGNGSIGTTPWGTKGFLESRNIGYEIIYEENVLVPEGMRENEYKLRESIDDITKDGNIFIFTGWNKGNAGAHTVAITKGMNHDESSMPILAYEFNTGNASFNSMKEFLSTFRSYITLYRIH